MGLEKVRDAAAAFQKAEAAFQKGDAAFQKADGIQKKLDAERKRDEELSHLFEQASERDHRPSFDRLRQLAQEKDPTIRDTAASYVKTIRAIGTFFTAILLLSQLDPR